MLEKPLSRPGNVAIKADFLGNGDGGSERTPNPIKGKKNEEDEGRKGR